jgi:hypothetical protein
MGNRENGGNLGGFGRSLGYFWVCFKRKYYEKEREF